MDDVAVVPVRTVRGDGWRGRRGGRGRRWGRGRRSGPRSAAAPAPLPEPAAHGLRGRRPLRPRPGELPPSQVLDHPTGRLARGEPRLRLRAEARPGVGPGQVTGAVRGEKTRPEQVEGPGTPRGEAVRRPPHRPERHHQVPPRPAPQPLRIPVRLAEPHGHAERQVQQRPRAVPPAHADRARRRLPQPLTLIERPRHPPHDAAAGCHGSAPVPRGRRTDPCPSRRG